MTITKAEIHKMLLEHDIDDTGELNFDEFKLIFASEEENEAARYVKSAVITMKESLEILEVKRQTSFDEDEEKAIIEEKTTILPKINSSITNKSNKYDLSVNTGGLSMIQEAECESPSPLSPKMKLSQ